MRCRTEKTRDLKTENKAEMPDCSELKYQPNREAPAKSSLKKCQVV